MEIDLLLGNAGGTKRSKAVKSAITTCPWPSPSSLIGRSSGSFNKLYFAKIRQGSTAEPRNWREVAVGTMFDNWAYD